VPSYAGTAASTQVMKLPSTRVPRTSAGETTRRRGSCCCRCSTRGADTRIPWSRTQDVPLALTIGLTDLGSLRPAHPGSNATLQDEAVRLPGVPAYCSATSTGTSPRPERRGPSALPMTAPKAFIGSVAFMAWPGVGAVVSRSPTPTGA
jgi:hypothetical protein